MIITEVHAEDDWVLGVVSDDGRTGSFDVKPYLGYEAFEALRDLREFSRVSSGGYFIEWACGADLSADTIEARWQMETRTIGGRKANRPLQGTLLGSRP
jgi:hypothetical protein